MLRTRHGRPATLWLQILLVAGLACVSIVLVQAYRAQRSSRVVAERALQDYAHFAAWSYREHLSVRLREITGELLGAVNHGDELHRNPSVPDAAEMTRYLAQDGRCDCPITRHGPMPQRYLGLTLGSDTVGIAPTAGERGASWPANRWDAHRVAVSSEDRMLNRLLSDMGRSSQEAWGFVVRIIDIDGRPRLIGTRAMPTEWGDTVVYAYDHGPDAIDTILGSLLASGDLLPSTIVGGLRNAEVFDLEVTDPTGALLFRSGSPARWDLAASNSLPESFGGFRIRAQLRPQMSEAILIGGVPESRVPILLAILALALGLTVLAAVQLRREVRFAADRATFVANVSHELRTPLTQVRLVIDSIRLGRLTDASAGERSLAIADREVLRLQHLVDGLLSFTRGPRRNGAPPVAVDAAHETRTVVAEFEPLARQHDVRVEVGGDDTVAARLTNGALRQVLLNLLDNAVKYGGDGSSVRVDVRRHDGGGVRLTVDDSGSGVPPGDRKRIWRAFQRGDQARTRAVGGSGIGLTIVREIAESHGGRVAVEDAPGGGARFVVDMPDAPG